MKGIILLAHGSRDPDWVIPFEGIRARVENLRPQWKVALAYLEHSVPDFATAADDLAARGVESVSVVPLFLGSGGHVRRDVPELLERAMRSHPRMKFEAVPFVGDADAVLQAIADYAAGQRA